MHSDFTLQVNLSPGDVSYAAITAKKLALQHMSIATRLLVVDCCKPQKTKLVNPENRFPEPQFSQRVEQIILIANKLKTEGYFTEVKFLFPADPLFKLLSKKYLNNIVHTTHGVGGTAQMAYWTGIELATTRYVIHYDGDMILYQEPGYSWWLEAVECMEKEPNAILAIPRHAPPNILTGDLPTHREGTEIIAKKGYWLHNWFSTRFFLIDKFRLTNELPLVRGRVKLELLLRKYLRRAFPLDPEIIMFRRLGLEKGKRRLILKSTKAWALHPHSKPKLFVDLVQKIYESVETGVFPQEQGGFEEIDLELWAKFLEKK